MYNLRMTCLYVQNQFEVTELDSTEVFSSKSAALTMLTQKEAEVL